MALRQSLDDLDTNGQVGDWAFTTDDTHLFIILMEGDHGLAGLPIKPDPDRPFGPVWQWDGNREAPTLTPSILHHSKPEWHGWMRSGQLVLA